MKLMLSKRIHSMDGKILIMGLAFKENCPDTRSNQVVDIIDTLQSYHSHIDVFDPWVDSEQSELLVSQPEENSYDSVVIAVAHDKFKELGIDAIRKFAKEKAVIFDVKHIFDA